MNSIRQWLYKPRGEDNSLLAQFYRADQELSLVAVELDCFDGRKDPERCSLLVNKLRVCQDQVLGICHEIMEVAIPEERAVRDFRCKFPEDVLQENLAGLLWFGAECLAAGSNIVNRETESGAMRPLAKALTRSLDNMRRLLREQCLRNPHEYPEKVRESLKTFDRLFAEFELSYVSAMVPIKSAREYHLQQEVTVLYSETLRRAIESELVAQEMVDTCDPALMFTIPRLAIVGGLLLFPDGPLDVDKRQPPHLSELYRPFYGLLRKIRELLRTLSREELWRLEKTLCRPDEGTPPAREPDLGRSDGSGWKRFVRDFCSHNFGSAEGAASRFQRKVWRSDDPDDDARHVPERKSGEQTQCSAVRLSESAAAAAAPSECWWPRLCDAFELRAIPRWPVEASQPPVPRPERLEHDLDYGRASQLRESPSRPPTLPQVGRLRRRESPSSSASSLSSDSDWGSRPSAETSPYDSECQDDEEIALALQAVEIAFCNRPRSRFKSSDDLVHRLFVCISGVADQLQTNFASEMRHILKGVFAINCSADPPSPREASPSQEDRDDGAVEAVPLDDCPPAAAPSWLPDDLTSTCMECDAQFTLLRRRHHCRQCGKIFCSRCSAHSMSLPHYGYSQPVRVCNSCFLRRPAGVHRSTRIDVF